MSLDILGIGESALSAFQMGVAVSSKNIADSADPDYSREIIECSAMVGGSVNVDIKRISDHFLTVQMNEAQSAYSGSSASSNILSSIDQMVTGLNGTDTNGSYNLLTRNMQSFFDSLSSLSGSTTTAGRQAVISQAGLLANTLAGAQQYINQQQGNAYQKITDDVSQINSLSQQIAKLNDKIQRNPSSNDLLDQQEKLVNQLSQYTSITTSKNGSDLNISMSNGTSLVAGVASTTLSTQKDAYDQKMQIVANGAVITSTANLSGSLGGLLNTANNQIPAIQQQLGVFATTLVTKFNQQNQAGYVSANTHGGNIFQPITGGGIANKDNQGNAQLSVAIDPATVSGLKATSYTLTKTVAGDYEVTNNASGAKTVFTTLPITIDGLKISQTGAMSTGDSFLINPMDQASGAMQVVAGPNDIAVSGQADGSGNANINALAGLANQKIMNAGQDTFTSGISSIFSSIGTQSQFAINQSSSDKIALTHASNDRQSVSGVSTQEEYTNIINFQQSYAAAAKIISTDQRLFNDMLDAIGG
jgi:flagellar hook-associated protein 1 FlgK